LLRKTLRFLPALVLAFALLGLAMLYAPRQAAAEGERTGGHVLPDAVVHRQISRYQHETWRWQGLMGVRRTPTRHSAVKDRSRAFKLWMRNLWHRRAVRARRLAARPPHRAAWLCIQRSEGAWTDPDPPYYGGLQMDISFQHAYGRELLRRKGTADNWTPLEQMWVAERARRSGRGFYPWPNTARHCGLI
jgi:hypothetical protein